MKNEKRERLNNLLGRISLSELKDRVIVLKNKALANTNTSNIVLYNKNLGYAQCAEDILKLIDS